MSSVNNGVTPPMGGLEALVAAASAANQAGNSKGRGKRKRSVVDADIDPALRDANTDTASALMSLFTNPIFISALAASSQTAATASSGHSQSQHNNTHLYTQLLSSNMPQPAMNAPTPFQQTRSGRISRPPTQPSYDFLQALTADGDSGNFESLLGILVGSANTSNTNGTSMSGGNGSIQAMSGMNPTGTGFGTLNNMGGSQTNTPSHVNTNPNTVSTNTAPHAMSSGNNWTAQTLAEAAGQHTVQFDLPSVVEDRSHNSGNSTTALKLPEWPLPPQGPGSRLAMSAEEIAARRRARNRAAAMETRRKHKEHVDSMEKQSQQVQQAYTVLQAHCRNLEHQVEQLQQIITSAGLSLPSSVTLPQTMFTPSFSFDMPTPVSEMPPPPPPMTTQPISHPSVSALSVPGTNATEINDTPATYTSMGDSPFPSFDMFFNVDMDGEDDGDFLPPSTPPNESDGETDGNARKKRKGKGKKKGRAEEEDDEDDEFEDDDVEDEDLFEPIEDVPIPPTHQMDSAMRSLGVDNQEQLASLINKMVVAGKEGMTSEMVDKLKVLLSLVGPNGSWTEGEAGGQAQQRDASGSTEK